jgi:nitrogen-specific signal transduction histidine kinase
MSIASRVMRIVSYGAAAISLAFIIAFAPLPDPDEALATLMLVTLASLARLQLPRTRREIVPIYPMLLAGIWIAGPYTAMIALSPCVISLIYQRLVKKELLSPQYPHPASLVIISALCGFLFLKTGGTLSFPSITPSLVAPLMLSTAAFFVLAAIEPLFSPGRKAELLSGSLRLGGMARLIDCAFVPLSLMIVLISSNWSFYYLTFLLLPMLFIFFFLKKSFRHFQEKDELTIFYRFTTLIRSSLNLEQILKDLAEELMEVTGAEGAMLALVDGNSITLMISKGRLENLPPPGESIMNTLILPRLARPEETKTLSEEHMREWLPEKMEREFSLTPLLEENSLRGFILSMKESFSSQDHKYLAIIAAQASSSITNASLYRQALKANEELRLAQAQLIQSGKMAAVGQLAAGVAHELNNPLGAVLTNFQTLPPFLGERDDLREKLKEAEKAVLECKGIIEKLLHYSRQAEMSDQQVSLKAVILDTLELLREQCELEQIRVIEELLDTPEILGNPNHLQQVVTNLFVNAFDAVKEAGHGHGLIMVRAFQEGKEICFSVEDNGTGIADDIKGDIFNPLFTTRGIGKAAGLGLSISRDIVHRYGGTIAMETKVNESTRFTVKLPMVKGAV